MIVLMELIAEIKRWVSAWIALGTFGCGLVLGQTKPANPPKPPNIDWSTDGTTTSLPNCADAHGSEPCWASSVVQQRSPTDDAGGPYGVFLSPDGTWSLLDEQGVVLSVTKRGRITFGGTDSPDSGATAIKLFLEDAKDHGVVGVCSDPKVSPSAHGEWIPWEGGQLWVAYTDGIEPLALVPVLMPNCGSKITKPPTSSAGTVPAKLCSG